MKKQNSDARKRAEKIISILEAGPVHRDTLSAKVRAYGERLSRSISLAKYYVDGTGMVIVKNRITNEYHMIHEDEMPEWKAANVRGRHAKNEPSCQYLSPLTDHPFWVSGSRDVVRSKMDLKAFEAWRDSFFEPSKPELDRPRGYGFPRSKGLRNQRDASG